MEWNVWDDVREWALWTAHPVVRAARNAYWWAWAVAATAETRVWCWQQRRGLARRLQARRKG